MQVQRERHRYLTVVRIVDRADFNRVLEETAFHDPQSAHDYGVSQRTAIRLKRAAESETDDAFIEAIEYETRQLELFDY